MVPIRLRESRHQRASWWADLSKQTAIICLGQTTSVRYRRRFDAPPMVQIIKPRTLGLLTKAERRQTGASFILTALAMFDLADPSAGFESEQALWLAAAKALPPGGILDIAMPKPVAEVMIAGHARPPRGEAVTAMTVAARVGGFEKRLAVIGDRVWRAGDRGYEATPPRPFTEMPLVPARAFGGPEHPGNRFGTGHRAMAGVAAGTLVALPNIERPERLIHAIDDDPPPATFGAGDLESPQRRRFAGTYDQRWAETIAPALPHDVDPRLFLLAAEDQWLDGHLEGDEPYALAGFAADAPSIEGRLPGLRVRGFVTMADRREALIELPMVIDTLWLLAGARRGILIWRGAKPVADIEANDVADVILSYERTGEVPRPLAEIAEFRRLRSDRETSARVALTDGPLVPPPDRAAGERRRAARSARAEAEAARRQAAFVWLTERQLTEAGVPRALWPELPSPEAPVLLPTPEEIASGDIDLGELLDTIETERKKAEAHLAAAVAEGERMKAAVAGFGAADAAPDAIDTLLANLAGLGMAEVPLAAVDAAAAENAAVELPLEADPAVAAEIRAALETGRDWRRQVFARAAAPAVDEDAEVAAAVARMFARPEASPLAAARDALAEVRAADLATEMPGLDPEAAAAIRPAGAAASGLTASLDELMPKDVPGAADAARTASDTLDDVGRRITAGLPALRGEPAPLDRLLAELTAGAPAAPSGSASEALAGAARQRDDLVDASFATIEEGEARLAAATASLRRAALEPLYPQEPLSAGAARRFGARITAEAAAGLVLAGRDLAGADLSGADLSGRDLAGAMFEKANLSGARLAGANLAGAVLAGAILDDADLGGCILDEANLAGVSARRTRFAGARFLDSAVINADLAGADLTGCRLTGLRFLRTSLAGADLTQAVLSAATFIECGLAAARLDGATIEATQFLVTDLSGAAARRATLRGSSFIDTDAGGADFSEARIEGCGFAGKVGFAGARFDAAEAPGTTWNGGDFRGASFRRARLDRAILSGADLEGASLRLASLVQARLDGCRLVAADLAAANLREVALHRADASGASFRGASLYGADVTDITIAGADLTGANLGKTILGLVGSRAA